MAAVAGQVSGVLEVDEVALNGAGRNGRARGRHRCGDLLRGRWTEDSQRPPDRLGGVTLLGWLAIGVQVRCLDAVVADQLKHDLFAALESPDRLDVAAQAQAGDILLDGLVVLIGAARHAIDGELFAVGPDGFPHLLAGALAPDHGQVSRVFAEAHFEVLGLGAAPVYSSRFRRWRSASSSSRRP